MGNVYVAPGAVVVMRRTDWLAAFGDAQNVTISPGAKVVALPDEATVAEVLAAIAALTPPPMASPTG